MSDEFPFLSTASNNSNVDLPPFKEFAWDFDSNSFIFDGNGNHIVLEGIDALKVWIFKALKTERFAYLAYSWRFGMELHNFVGKVLGVKERQSELRRMIIECLMVNPYIRSIDSIDFVKSNNGKDVAINISLTTIYGSINL